MEGWRNNSGDIYAEAPWFTAAPRPALIEELPTEHDHS